MAGTSNAVDVEARVDAAAARAAIESHIRSCEEFNRQSNDLQAETRASIVAGGEKTSQAIARLHARIDGLKNAVISLLVTIVLALIAYVVMQIWGAPK